MTTISDGTTTVTPLAVTSWLTSRPSRNVVHTIIDRAEPEVTLREAGLRVGTLEATFEFLADAIEAENLHAQAATFTLTDDVVGILEYVVGDGEIELEQDSTTKNAWHLRVPFQEVAGA